ncbi:MAG: FAD-dependent oxidoreductase [Fibrobacteria bacterium]|nr:FAD-dependent oxidoreductase [Fibrobacteria bacterium]
MSKNKKVGSVLVVGSGIAGMQAALDSANAGFKVYLLEEQASIGGNMARLDKTFPTNDCAMCMISPKLVEVGRHLNIDILAYSDLKKLEGEAGNFEVTVNRRARFVDEEKCNGCGECEQACPVAMQDTFNGELSERKAIYRMYPQAIPNVFTINKKEVPPPCRAICPAGVNAQGYVALIGKGKFLDALDVVRERMPFAGACGRICHHPCEQNCNRAEIDEAVSVRNLKRFVADYEWERMSKGLPVDREPNEMVTPPKEDYKEKIAIVGGGPAGLTCAIGLAKKGYSVSVFDANKQLGGMMRTGIPSYRLPREFLDHEIKLALEEGIEVNSGQILGKDFELKDLKKKGFKSVFVATGAQLAKKIPLEGSDKQGVLYGIPFLKEVNTGGKPDIGKKVVVIGGGNVAMDVARSAQRVIGNGKVSLFCLESEAEMPAHSWEISEAREEGIEINPSWGPLQVTGNGKVEGFEVKKCKAVFDSEGKFNPQFDEATTQLIEADSVILAIGQNCDLSFLGKDIETGRGVITADPLTLETTQEGVFAGGDTVLGPASLVQAVAQGHRAAESIHRYLRKLDLREDRKPVDPADEVAGVPDYVGHTCSPRAKMPKADASTRKMGFTEIDSGFSEEMAVAEAQRCLNCGGCSYCLECVRVCKAHAVNHEMKDKEITFNVGAVILANGYDVFDAKRKAEYGFGRYPNVVTSLQFERILSASGPYSGHLKRPGDGKTPKKVAWIQCVGSRDVTVGKDYCSSVCCMYATKQAIIAKEHEQRVEATIFFIDMRSFGKGFESFYNRAKNDYGTRYIRSQVSSVKEMPGSGNLLLKYISEGTQQVTEEEFDIVVLSVGLQAHHAIKDVARIADVNCNKYGFIEGQPYKSLLSNKPGIFLTGAVNGPKDIPETVQQSSAAAALCGEMLQSVRNTEVKIMEYPEEKDVMGEEPRIGVFVCHCGINISSVVDVADVSEYIKTIPGVVFTDHTIYTCSQDTQKRMKEVIKEHNLNRVIVASCTPRTHEPLFQETMREAGLNKFLFEMADIREQCSWVHQKEPEKATEKAKQLIRGSVGKSKLLEPIQFKKVGITKAALVMGGGLSGMTASVSLAKQGFQVYLVEKEKELGGNLVHIKYSLEGHDWQDYLKKTIDEVNNLSNIQVFTDTNVDMVSGYVGNFSTKLITGTKEEDIIHGAIVLATGAQGFSPTEFLYGENEHVVTQREFDAKLEDGISPSSVVMIQCVGSRCEERPYCSRVCCGAAVKNALTVKEKNPDAKVYVLYREIRTYEFKEAYYRKAREKGVMFIHFPDEQYPEVSASGEGLSVKVMDTVLNKELTLSAETVVLSAAIEPNRENNRTLGKMLKASLNEDEFFMEAHVKLRPVDFANEGIFVCGLAHSPKYSEENIMQALAVAGRAACILSKDSLEVGGVVSVVDPDKCASCLTCVRECIYDAPFINKDGKAEIEAVKCQGCGNCASACPGKAIQLRTFTDKQEKELFYSILKEPEVTE